MFTWFKQRLFAWVDRYQKREIERLRQQTMQLKEEVERETGKPIQLTSEDRRRLAEKAKGIDPETLKQISIIGPEQFLESEPENDPTENR